jgi:hypothetical protein
VLVDGWRGHNELTAAARRTLAAPDSTELVRPATHRITVTRQPYVRIVVNGQSVADVELGLTLVFDISAMTAGVSAGQLVALHSGRCSITATLAIQGTEVLVRQSQIDLPAAISLPAASALLPAQDYAAASQGTGLAGGDFAETETPVTQTIQIALIPPAVESTATQPTITALPCQRDPNIPTQKADTT